MGHSLSTTTMASCAREVTLLTISNMASGESGGRMASVLMRASFIAATSKGMGGSGLKMEQRRHLQMLKMWEHIDLIMKLRKKNEINSCCR